MSSQSYSDFRVNGSESEKIWGNLDILFESCEIGFGFFYNDAEVIVLLCSVEA